LSIHTEAFSGEKKLIPFGVGFFCFSFTGEITTNSWTNAIKAIQQATWRAEMKKICLILVVFAFLIGCASTGPLPEVGDSAPDFGLVDVSGNEIRLSDFRGKKKVVLIFYLDSG
jgi:hypothetical protein